MKLEFKMKIQVRCSFNRTSFEHSLPTINQSVSSIRLISPENTEFRIKVGQTSTQYSTNGYLSVKDIVSGKETDMHLIVNACGTERPSFTRCGDFPDTWSLDRVDSPKIEFRDFQDDEVVVEYTYACVV